MALLLICCLLAAAAPLDLSVWKYRKRIPVTAGDRLAVVKLDREVYMGSDLPPFYQDLRVIRDEVEVPYILETPGMGDEYVERAQTPFDLSVVEGPGVQFTINAGHDRHNLIQIGTTLQNFRQRVRIETSQDGTHWATARDNGEIFDFTRESRKFSSLDVSFPVSTKPYLRVTVFGWNKTSTIQGVSVAHDVERQPLRETLATIPPRITEDPETSSTFATVDLGVKGLPVNRIVLESSSKQFHRAVDLEVSNNGKDWTNLSQGVIARLPGDDFTEEKLALSFQESYSGHFRLRIYNRDDQPIQIGRVELEGVIRNVKFIPSTPGNYWLYFGNDSAHGASYDLSVLLSKRAHLTETNWTLGPAEPNPAYRPPPAPRKPWSEQHPAILYTVLGVAVLALGIATLRFAVRLRTPA